MGYLIKKYGINSSFKHVSILDIYSELRLLCFIIFMMFDRIFSEQ